MKVPPKRDRVISDAALLGRAGDLAGHWTTLRDDDRTKHERLENLHAIARRHGAPALDLLEQAAPRGGLTERALCTAVYRHGPGPFQRVLMEPSEVSPNKRILATAAELTFHGEPVASAIQHAGFAPVAILTELESRWAVDRDDQRRDTLTRESLGHGPSAQFLQTIRVLGTLPAGAPLAPAFCDAFAHWLNAHPNANAEQTHAALFPVSAPADVLAKTHAALQRLSTAGRARQWAARAGFTEPAGMARARLEADARQHARSLLRAIQEMRNP